MTQYTKVIEHAGGTIELTSGDVNIFAELVQPQPQNLPPGLVVIKLPYNCYIDLNKRPEI